MNFLVYAEVRDGKVKQASLEALSECVRLAKASGGSVAAALVGEGVRAHAEALGKHGASKVYVAESPRLKLYAPEAVAKAAAAAVTAAGAEALVLAATAQGRDVAAGAAAVLQTSVAGDCTALSIEAGRLQARRSVYSGKAWATVAFKSAPAVVTLRPNAFRAEPTGGTAAVEDLAVTFDEADFRSAAKEVVATAQGKAELTEASVVVSGGRGLKDPANFKLRDDLAAVLGAAVGASRAVVDNGWRPHSEQVGQTGKTVAPNLYIALGISGAIQHLAGMKTAKVIVAVNKDPEAPIFKIATYGIVGDVLEVTPALTQELKKVLGA